ncbi:hypothetical protein [Dysgonomonas reticulitermitis]
MTVGESKKPESFSVLEISTNLTKGGLRLPRLTTDERIALTGSSSFQAESEKASGLMIYNTTTNCVEYWNKQKWVSFCDQPCAEPDPATVDPLVDQTVNAIAGGDFTLGPVSVGYTSGSPQTAYLWYINDTNDYVTPTPLASETSHTLTDNKPAGTYYYFCEMTNADCTGNSVRTGIYTVTVASNPASIPLGTGTLYGKTCFDINKSNWDPECGTQESRASVAVDFATLGPVTYVFTAPKNGTISDLRFQIVDPEDCVTSYLGGKLGTIAGGEEIELTVNYATDLSDVSGKIYKRRRDAAAHVTIYAIYNDGVQEVSIPLLVNIQDCICCGAYVAVGVWKEFMCHNLGANQGLNPFSPAKGLNGDYYQWGQKDPVATVDTPYSAAISGWSTSGIGYNLWGTPKTSNDPCPRGYRVPTLAEWSGVIDEDEYDNTLRLNPYTDPSDASWTNDETNFSSGRFFGPALYLPAAGHRFEGNGAGGFRGNVGFYWSTHKASVTQTGRLCIYEHEGGTYTDPYTSSSYYGYSIRCIAE